MLAVAGWLAYRWESRLTGWGWRALLAGALVGRAGHVIAYWPVYAAAPWSIPAFWQGGFLAPAAVAGAAAYGFWCFRHHPRSLALALLPLVAGLGVWIALNAGQGWLAAPADIRLPGQARPTLAGEARLAAAGEPAVVNLWASWCPPCRREMPRLAKAASRWPEAAFAFVNQGEDRGTVAAFGERYGLAPDRVFLDPGRQLARRFGTVGLPTTLFFDRRGRLQGVHVGEIARAALDQRLERLTRR